MQQTPAVSPHRPASSSFRLPCSSFSEGYTGEIGKIEKIGRYLILKERGPSDFFLLEELFLPRKAPGKKFDFWGTSLPHFPFLFIFPIFTSWSFAHRKTAPRGTGFRRGPTPIGGEQQACWQNSCSQPGGNNSRPLQSTLLRKVG